MRGHDVTGVVLLLLDVVDDELLSVLIIWCQPGVVQRTHDVDLNVDGKTDNRRKARSNKSK